MRRRDFLKGLSAVFGAAVLPVAASASLISGQSADMVIIDEGFVPEAEQDANALRELRRLIHVVAQRWGHAGRVFFFIDPGLADRVTRYMNGCERVCVGQDAKQFRREIEFWLDGYQVGVDPIVEPTPLSHRVRAFCDRGRTFQVDIYPIRLLQRS